MMAIVSAYYTWKIREIILFSKVSEHAANDDCLNLLLGIKKYKIQLEEASEGKSNNKINV